MKNFKNYPLLTKGDMKTDLAYRPYLLTEPDNRTLRVDMGDCRM